MESPNNSKPNVHTLASVISPSQDVTLSVPPGNLLCVYGPTGGGKTSLLLSLLGEIPRLSGRASLQGHVAYVAQKGEHRSP